MINPYMPYYMPKSPSQFVQTAAHVQVVLDQFKAEIKAIQSSGQVAQRALDASKDVLIQLHPDLAADIDQIEMFAQEVGVSSGEADSLIDLQNQYYSALPYDIKQVVPAP